MHRLSHTLATRRAALAATAAVILTLACFAVWAAHTTNQSINDVQRLTSISDAYQTARHAVAQENLAARRYQLTPARSHIVEFEQARASLNSALAVVSRLDETKNVRVATVVRSQNDQAAVWFAKLPLYITRNADIAKIVTVSDRRLQPLFDSMTATLDRSGQQHRSAALASLRSARDSERVVLVTTAITITLGLLLLTAAAAAMRYRERLERIRQRELERLKKVALTDSLTGLGNHRAFEEALAGQLTEALEAGEPLSLALLDLDGLKQTNDARGHQAGDESIRALAAILEEAGPGTGAYRTGGDEFALIARGRRAVDTLYLVQQLQSRLAARAVDWPLSASGGVAEAIDGLGRDTLIRRADLALIQTKRSHRRCLLYNEALEPAPASPQRGAERHETDSLATALARAVDAKDSHGHSHCETVSELCGLIAQELGMRPERIAQLRLAGLLHDVGTIGIADAILQKPGPLDANEFEVIKTHPRLGHAIVSAADRPIEAEWILHHHERVDGGGYPMGLAGDQIPLESRIILVADAFEAITAERPHRAPRSAEAALAELEAHAGSQFDPACVAAMRRIVRGHELRDAA
jgi:diguanylate cyclase (GGDEF)-like protein